MEIAKEREQLIKVFIIGISIIFFLTVTSILVFTEKIRFDWSDQILLKHKYEKNKNKFKKILILGDSQLEKWPMKHCLYKDIERFCRSRDIGYVNAAHHGFGPIEYKDRLVDITRDYKPTLIILFYYVGNDLSDVMLRDNDIPKKPTYDVIFTEGKKINTRKDRKGFIGSLINSLLISGTQKERILKESGFDWKDFKTIGIDSTIIEYAKNRIFYPNKIGPKYVNPHILALASWKPNYLFDNITINSNVSKYTWYKILEKFEEILTIAEQINSEICIVSIPSTAQVDTSHFDFYRKTTYNVSYELTHSNKPQNLLEEFSSASSVKYLDLLPYFRDYSNTAELYFENDDHLSEKGHLLAFNLVEDEILEPFYNMNKLYVKKERAHNYYKNYINWAIKGKMEEIRVDTNWFKEIKEKAIINNISIDSMLFLDAKYVLEDSIVNKTNVVK